MRRWLKQGANLFALLVVLPALLLYRIEAALFGAERVFAGWSQALSLLPGIYGVFLRRAFYKQVLRRCGNDCWIGFGTVFTHPGVEIGSYAYLGVYCCLGDVTIDDDVLIGSHVSIANGGAQHGISRLDVPIREQPGHWPRVTIGRDCWLGDRVVVLADIGAQCVVGAGSVVTKPLPNRAIAVGVPAKVLKFRTETEPESPLQLSATE